MALQEALNKNVLFKYLDDKTRSDIFDVMEPKDYQIGENIIAQGEYREDEEHVLYERLDVNLGEITQEVQVS